jgi:hypothetical protein
MRINATAHPRWTYLAWSAVFRIALLSIFGLIGWQWLVSAGGSARNAVTPVAVLALAALAGITWYASHARADWRWRAALDRYADQEQAKRTYPRRRRG